MEPFYFSFCGTRLLASGPLASVLAASYPFRDNLDSPLLIFSQDTGLQTDFDWRGTVEEVVERAQPKRPIQGPGRPRLGVVSVEVTLLPRHWEWLNAQPGRASGTLRRLVDQAMAQEARDPRRRWEVLGKILWALAGNEPGFEEAGRALYSGDAARLKALTAGWSGDLPAFVSEWIEQRSES
jgi:hypothetical protein